MENREAIPKWLNYVLIIILTAIIINNAVTIVSSDDPFGVNLNYVAFLNIIACTPAMYYCLSNHDKNASKAYIIFCVIYAITELLKLLLRTKAGVSIVLLPPTIVFASLVVLCLAKDLGKKKSYILAGIVVVMSAIDLVYVLVNYSESTMYMFQNLILSGCLFMMVYAKYKNKELRGSN